MLHKLAHVFVSGLNDRLAGPVYAIEAHPGKKQIRVSINLLAASGLLKIKKKMSGLRNYQVK